MRKKLPGKYRNRGIALMLTAAMAVNVMAPVCVQAKDKKENDKEETVYVNAGAEGDVEKITVSEWLKHKEGDTLEDYSSLKNIENVKGDEEYTQKSDGTLSWSNQGEDIYYQGETDEKLPVAVKVTYYLDGKRISPSELAGKSGDVKIRFDYTNNSMETVKVDGKNIDVYTPFTMVSAMILPNDVFSDVEVENGKVISDGDKSIVVGYAMPGLKDSLKLSTLEDFKDVDIPEYVEVTAHAEKFEIALTATAAMNGNLSDMDLKDIDNLDDLKDDVDKLTDASSQLVDGSGELLDGMETLQSSLKTYTKGVDTVDSGTAELTKGLKTLDKNKKALKKGTGDLTEGLKDLEKGTKALDTGITSYTKGVTTLDQGIEATVTGAAALKSGASTLSKGLKEYTAGAKKLEESISLMNQKLKEGSGAMEEAGKAAAGLAENAKKLQGKISELNEMTKQLSGLQSSLSSYKSEVESWAGKVSAAADGINAKASSQAEEKANSQATDEARRKARSAVEQAVSGMDELTSEQKNKIIDSVSGISISGISIDIDADDEVKDALGGFPQFNMPSMNFDVDGLSSILTEMNGQAKALEGLSGLGSMTEGTSALESGAKELTKNNDSLLQGMKQLSDGINSLQTALTKLEKGASTLVKNNKELTDGSGTLKKGAGQLYTGSKKLDAGMKQATEAIGLLAKGSMELKAGTGKLSSAGGAVNSGAGKLSDGARALADGMQEFDEEGISQIADLAGEDLETVANRMKALKKADKNYQSFAGMKDGHKGSVKFIIETAAIETEDDAEE